MLHVPSPTVSVNGKRLGIRISIGYTPGNELRRYTRGIEFIFTWDRNHGRDMERYVRTSTGRVYVRGGTGSDPI